MDLIPTLFIGILGVNVVVLYHTYIVETVLTRKPILDSIQGVIFYFQTRLKLQKYFDTKIIRIKVFAIRIFKLYFICIKAFCGFYSRLICPMPPRLLHPL